MTAPSKTARSGPPALVSETPLTPQPPALILFGQDGGRLRAAWFDAADAQAAAAAAVIMRLRVLPLKDAVGRDLAGRIARGRVLPSGRALVPLTKRVFYTQLVALADEGAGLSIADGGQVGSPLTNEQPTAASPREIETPIADASVTERGEAGPSAGAIETTQAVTSSAAERLATSRPGDRTFVGSPRPNDRSEIGLGSVVLAHEGPDDGWWEAEVIGINGRVFSLRWCDYPTNPTILRNAGALALLPPGEA